MPSLPHSVIGRVVCRTVGCPGPRLVAPRSASEVRALTQLRHKDDDDVADLLSGLDIAIGLDDVLQRVTYVTRGRGNSVLPRSCPPSLSRATRRWSTPKTAGSRRSGWPTSTLVAR